MPKSAHRAAYWIAIPEVVYAALPDPSWPLEWSSHRPTITDVAKSSPTEVNKAIPSAVGQRRLTDHVTPCPRTRRVCASAGLTIGAATGVAMFVWASRRLSVAV
jgi:hypothetical protein